MEVTVNGAPRLVDVSNPDVATLIRLLGLEGKRIAVSQDDQLARLRELGGE